MFEFDLGLVVELFYVVRDLDGLPVALSAKKRLTVSASDGGVEVSRVEPVHVYGREHTSECTCAVLLCCCCTTCILSSTQSVITRQHGSGLLYPAPSQPTQASAPASEVPEPASSSRRDGGVTVGGRRGRRGGS